MTAPRVIGWAGLALAVLVIVFLNSVFIVDQRRQAVVLRLGQPQRVINAPGSSQAGLKWKAPFIDQVVLLDRRNQPLEADDVAITAADGSQLIVDGFLRFRISDPLRFYLALHDGRIASDRLQQLLASSLRETLGQASAHDIIAGRQDALMRLTTAEAVRKAKTAGLGVEVIDAELRRVALPESAEQAVYRRMQAAYAERAAQIRAAGEQRKRQIMAEADHEVANINIDATAQALKIRGEGDAKRAAIFAAAYGQDPDFAAFFRALQAYDTGLARPSTTFVLSPNSAFFNVLKAGPGAK